MAYTMIVMVYTMLMYYGQNHDIYHLPILYIPWYIPKMVNTTFEVVYAMRQPSRCLSAGGLHTAVIIALSVIWPAIPLLAMIILSVIWPAIPLLATVTSMPL